MTFKKVLMSSVTLACAISTTSVLAQQLALEEIVVTSKQREQNLQEVPLSITVFSTAELDRFGVEDVRDLASFTPNFNIYSGSGRQDASAVNVRGLSPNTSDERYQPVSFFVDGIFMGGTTVGLQTLDVERIEILKGPQSASYGRATYAGAIDFVTTTPSLEEFSGRISTQLSSNTFDNTNYDISGYFQGPIIEDKLSASLFVKVKRDDGFDQVPDGQFPEVGQEDSLAFNAVIYGQLAESTSLKLRAIYSEQDDQEAIYHTQQPLYWEQQGANIVTLPSGALWVQGTLPNPIRDGIRGVDLINNTIASPSEGGYERQRYFGSAILEHDFDNGMNFSYRGAYMRQDTDSFIDFRGRSLVGTDPIFGQQVPTPTGFAAFNLSFPFPFQEEHRDTSHQVRLLSSDDERLRWSAGAYYYWSRDSNFQARTDRTPPAGNPEQQTRGDENIINYAAFGSVAYDVTDQLTFGLEARVQKEEVTFRQLDGLAVSSGSRLAEDLIDKKTSFEPRVTLDYAVNDDQLLYALFAKGVKSGRWNTSFTAGFNPDGVTRPSAGFLFAPPEKLYNYEVGSKSTLLDGRAIFNVAAFYQEVKDQQLRQSVEIDQDLNGDGLNDILNQVFTGGDSRIWGFELEGTFQVTEELTFRGGVGYSDHEFKDDILPSADFDLFDFVGGRTLKGKTSVNVPKLSGNFSADYVTPIMGGDFDWRLRGDVIYTGSKYAELANIAKIGSYALVNLRTSLESEGYTVSLFVNNVFNEKTALGAGLTGTSFCEYRTNGPTLPAFNGAQRCAYTVPQRGREWGVSATLNF